MARRDALVRLATTLLVRNANLRQRLASELADLHDFRATDANGTGAEGVVENSSDDVSALFAELDALEVKQIELALARLKRGTCGICEANGENCQGMIPLARLNVLPYTRFCITCEREKEKLPQRQDWRSAAKWDQVVDTDASMRDLQLNVTELAMQLSGSRKS